MIGRYLLSTLRLKNKKISSRLLNTINRKKMNVKVVKTRNLRSREKDKQLELIQKLKCDVDGLKKETRE